MRDESLLIGGYNSVQTISGVDKVPLLGDLPLIGALFSNTSTQVQRRERLFLIRPTVVGEPARTGAAELAPLVAPAKPAVTPAAAVPAQPSTRAPEISPTNSPSAPVGSAVRNSSSQSPSSTAPRQTSPGRPGN